MHDDQSGDAKDATSEREATPWAHLLSSAKLRASGLKIETLAEQVGVSAAYLRLLRQGKRSASADTAARLLTHLGLEVKTKPNDDGADIVADDGKGNVVVVSAKTTRAGRPSALEKRMEEVLRATKDLQDTVTEGYGLWSDAVRWFERDEDPQVAPGESVLLRSVSTTLAESDPSDGDERGPAKRLPSVRKERGSHRPLPFVGAAMGSGLGLIMSNRPQVERLLRAVPDEDLPLAAAYLALLVDRSKSKKNR